MSRQKSPLIAAFDVEDLDDGFYPPLSATPTQSHAPMKSRDVRQSNSVETQTNGDLDEEEQKALQEIIRFLIILFHHVHYYFSGSFFYQIRCYSIFIRFLLI